MQVKDEKKDSYWEHRTATQILAYEAFGEALVQGVVPTLAHVAVTYGEVHNIYLDSADYQSWWLRASDAGKPVPIQYRDVIFTFPDDSTGNHSVVIGLEKMQQQRGEKMVKFWRKVRCTVMDPKSSEFYQPYFNANEGEGRAEWVGIVRQR